MVVLELGECRVASMGVVTCALLLLELLFVHVSCSLLSFDPV